MVPVTAHTHVRLKSIGRKKRKEQKKKAKKERKQEKERKEKKRKQGKEGKKHHTNNSRPYELTKDGIGLIEGIKYINGVGGRTQQGEKVRAALRYVVTAIGRPTSSNMMMARPRPRNTR